MHAAIKEDRTTNILSHSISQMIDADITCVLKEGRVVGHDTHGELYDNDGTYHEIFDASARSLKIDKISKTMDAIFRLMRCSKNQRYKQIKEMGNNGKEHRNYCHRLSPPRAPGEWKRTPQSHAAVCSLANTL